MQEQDKSIKKDGEKKTKQPSFHGLERKTLMPEFSLLTPFFICSQLQISYQVLSDILSICVLLP